MAAPTEKEITRLITAEDQAEKVKLFADSLILEPETIEGTRSRYIFSESSWKTEQA